MKSEFKFFVGFYQMQTDQTLIFHINSQVQLVMKMPVMEKIKVHPVLRQN